MNTHVATMQEHAKNYLKERHSLGFTLRSISYSINSFARYIDGIDYQGALTVEIMADWARQDKGNSNNPATWARRLKKLRSFARYLQQFEPDTEVPDDTIFGRVPSRVAPHIYTEDEIMDLLTAARQLKPLGGLRAATYTALFGLIASTGIRVSEAIHLLNTETDLKNGRLTIRQTKFGKSRYVSLHPTATEALRQYSSLRNSYIDVTGETPFFVGSRGQCLGQALSLRQVRRVFSQLRDQLKWINRGAHDAPRIHDLRHSFVVHRVMRWHAQGEDIDQKILALSTYIGHTCITHTYWYLTGVPELMALAGSKFEEFGQKLEVGHA